MAAEDFFARWAKKNTETRSNDALPLSPDAVLPEARASIGAPEADKPLPTLEDVARLTPDADFSPFVARGVDETVKRAAMKKLFSDPHFNVMDGLDVYIDDYNSFEALTPDIVATLNHAKALLNPPSQGSSPMMRLLDALDEEKDDAGRSASNEQSAATSQLAQPAAASHDTAAEEDATHTDDTSNPEPDSDVN